MKEKAYLPREGSIGDRSLQHLRAHGRTRKRDLADAIDAEMTSMDASLSLCISHGLIAKVEVAGGETSYEIPDGELRVMPEGVKIPEFISGIERTRIRAEAAPEADQNVAATIAQPSPTVATELEVWLSNRGRMRLEFHDAEYTLSEQEKNRLVDFVIKHEVTR